jgi:signal transduction histidine kinase
MSIRGNWWLFCTAGLTLAYGAISLASHPSYGLTTFGDLVALLLLAVGTLVMLGNAVGTKGDLRAFWSLLATSFVLWTMNQVGWTWVEVIKQHPLPDPFFGDTVLFIHTVPMMAAVALRPHRSPADKRLFFSTLNFLMLLFWWVFLYMFLVFPDEYVSLNVPVYSGNYDRLYLLQNLLLIGTLGLSVYRTMGPWRTLYRHFLIAAALYSLSSGLMNLAISRNRYYTGSLYDVIFVASVCWFIHLGLQARTQSLECQPSSGSESRWGALAPRLAMMAILSLPVMAFWVLFLDTSAPRLRQFRLMVALASMLVLGCFVFLKQYRLDKELMRLLNQSQKSYENLERLQNELIQKEKLASLGQLVAGAAHEINNPLAAILGYSELLSTNDALSADQRSMTQKLFQQARRTRDLVADLLSFAQQAPAEKNAVDISSLLQRVWKMEGVQAETKGVKIEMNVEPGVPRIWANANQLLQAILQIIDNAIDALEEVGGGRLAISLKKEGNDVVLQFSDTGPGIRDPQRVFDPFYTTKPIGKGTGLGLSAAYGVVQDHQGQIYCYNKAEGGAVFVLRLPTTIPEPPHAELAKVQAAN